MKLDKATLKTPIAWECKHCYFPGLVTRRCDAPGFCAYCGNKVSSVARVKIEQQIEAERQAEERESLRTWYATWPKREASHAD